MWVPFCFSFCPNFALKSCFAEDLRPHWVFFENLVTQIYLSKPRLLLNIEQVFTLQSGSFEPHHWGHILNWVYKLYLLNYASFQITWTRRNTNSQFSFQLMAAAALIFALKFIDEVFVISYYHLIDYSEWNCFGNL